MVIRARELSASPVLAEMSRVHHRWLSVLAFALLAAFACASPQQTGEEANNQLLHDQLHVLGKQVTALLERRRDDLRSIEEDMIRKLSQSEELLAVRQELQDLRLELEQMRNGNGKVHHHHHSAQNSQSTQEKNDHLTIKWLSQSVSEIRTEIVEIQTTLNSTVILQNHEQVGNELSLLRTDIMNLNKEVEISKSKSAKYEAEIEELREEVSSLRDAWKTTSGMCGKLKNQLKATQLEWNFNWKSLSERNEVVLAPEATNPSSLSSSSGVSASAAGESKPRHQRILKKHVLALEKSSAELRRSNEELQNKLLKLEEEVRILQEAQQQLTYEDSAIEQFDRINGNDIENLIRSNKLKAEILPTPASLDEKVAILEQQQKKNVITMSNLTRQLSNFDKLHMSLLELLENVESINNKVDNNFPEFRKEISKLEVQVQDSVAKMALLKEDQNNVRASMKAIGVSVSNLKDRVQNDEAQLKEYKVNLETLKKSTNVQSSKLHDHILKSESSTIEYNATKSTIHLVQELKSFEKEYKSIVNKLPYDCSAVQGPNGLYLISPGEGEPIMASCHDGWTTIQKRYDGSVNFNRNWTDYSNGFGSATGEHWLGNRNLHALTKDNCTKLEINMKDIYGKIWHVMYDDFRVASFSEGFKLTVDKYSGNASDALDYQNHMEFSTIDNDRDISNTHCASNYEGGWWFSHCQHANLNGRYNLGLTWFDSSRNEWIAVATSEMRVKRREHCHVY